MAEPLRSYTSFMVAFAEPARSRRARMRRCAALRPGDALMLEARDGGVVVVGHDGADLGVIPPAHGWVAASIAEGDTLACSVAAIEVNRWPVKRAVRIELRIDVLADGSVLGRAAQWSVTSVTRGVEVAADVGGMALRAAADAPAAAGRGAKFAALWTGRTIAAPAVNVVYRGVDGLAEIAVRKPARAVRRLVLWIVGLGFAAFALVLAILILLHTLPRRT